MIVLVVLLSLAVVGLFLVKHENASLRTSLDRASNVASGQQTTITMLKNQLHVALTRADLPDAVRRLHQRPACTDASDCPQRLPESEPLPDAGQRPGDER